MGHGDELWELYSISFSASICPSVPVLISASMAQFLLLLENVREGSEGGEGHGKGRWFI